MLLKKKMSTKIYIRNENEEKRVIREHVERDYENVGWKEEVYKLDDDIT